MTSWPLDHCGICLHRFEPRSRVVAHGAKPHHFHKHCAINLAMQNEIVGKVAQCPLCHQPFHCESLYSLKDKAVKWLKIGHSTLFNSASSLKKRLSTAPFQLRL